MQIKEINVSRPVCFNIGQQYSNEVLVIHFKGLPDLPNKYIYVKKDNYEKEVPLVGDLYVVSRPLTTYNGEVKAQIIARDPGSTPIALTPNFKMMITPSDYSGIGEDESYPEDPNIKNYYVKIDGKIQSMDELIALVQSKLDNGEFIGAQGPKGEKGEPGEKGDPGSVTKEFKDLASQIAQNASDAQDSATSAQASATNAQKALDDTKDFANQAISEVNQIKTDTNTLKDEANTSAVNAKASEDKAKEYADNLKESTDAISQNTKAINELNDKKITKFYASSQGETHITDSDNGKIQDMMIYGKSSQDGTPSPENPIEIKNVVNPTIKAYGANILRLNDIEESTFTTTGITFSVKDGLIKTKGTVLADGNISTSVSGTINIVEPLTLQSGKTYIYNPNPIKGAESLDCYLDFTNSNTLGFSLANQNFNKPIKVTDLQVKFPFLLNLILKKGAVVDMEWKPQVLLNEVLLPYEPYIEQSVTLPITLNAIPVSSGGNITIDEKQYIADRVVEKEGVYGIERNVVDAFKDISNTSIEIDATSNNTNKFRIECTDILKNSLYACICNILPYKIIWNVDNEGIYADSQYVVLRINKSTCGEDEQTAKDWLINNINKFHVYAWLNNSKFEPLSSDVQEKIKMLSTYYPVTNISVNSEQLDGYTVFNYPISLANGWNYVKQQLNDNRDYIYDMDLQSAEAYVNSEYAVTLTELEV